MNEYGPYDLGNPSNFESLSKLVTAFMLYLEDKQVKD